jgi:protein-S-isoprenylcysteine O-methyltransferase Ste14
MRWRVRLGYPLTLIFWLLANPTPRSIFIGAWIGVVGLLVRGAAAGYLRKDRELAISGPYARTRNPLYLGSAILAAGIVVAGNSFWAGVLTALYFSIFYSAVMRNEEADLRDRFGPAFNHYAARIPLFIPHLVGGSHRELQSANPPEQFSWTQFNRNREYRALLGAVAGLGALFLRLWLRKSYGY